MTIDSFRAGVIAGAITIALVSVAGSQTPSAAPTMMPSAWVQLGNAIDNSGAIPGTISTRWEYRATTPVRGLSVAAGVVILGTESADAEGEPKTPNQHGSIAALDAMTGQLLWIQTLPSWVHGDPVIYSGLVIVTYGRWPMTYLGGIAAYRIRDGTRLWSVKTLNGNMAAAALDIGTNSLVALGGDGVLLRMSPTDGRILKQTGVRAPDAMSGPRILADGKIVFGAGNIVASYSISTDSVLWRFHPALLHSLGDVPVAVSDSLIFTAGIRNVGIRNALRALPLSQFLPLVWEGLRTKKMRSFRTWFQQQWLIALDRNSGRSVWRQPLGIGLEVPRNTAGTPVVSDGRVIISSPISKLVAAFEIKSGKVLWVHSLSSVHKGPVTVIGGDVLLGDKAGTLHLLRAANGSELGSCNAGGAFTPTGPILVGKTFIAATRDGWVHASPYVDVRKQMLMRTGRKCFAD